MSYEEETTDLRARVRELEQALDEAPSRDRLRELEAELAAVVRHDARDGKEILRLRDLVIRASARAENAERERDELQAYIDMFGWNADAKKRIAEVREREAEARVAELEAFKDSIPAQWLAWSQKIQTVCSVHLDHPVDDCPHWSDEREAE